MTKTLSLTALLALSLSGCFYPAERGKMMEERVNKLEANQQDLQAALSAQKERLEAQIPMIEEALDKLDKASRRSTADVGVQVEQMRTDMAELRGKLEEHLFRLNEVQAALAALKEGKAPAEQAAGTPAPPVEKPTDKKAFAELVERTLADKPEEGRALAGEWLRKWPTDPLAARVHYALGATYFDEKNCRAALAEFGALIKSFAKSEQAPDALLKSSECFASLKMKEESRLALEEIVGGYPKSEAAKTAKARLAAHKPEKKAKPGKGHK